MRLLVTGGAGFIGSHFVDRRLRRHPRDLVVVLDKLTYAGNLANLAQARRHARFRFQRGDICEAATVDRLVRRHRIEAIVNFAAETHVDRSILKPGEFTRTDILGTQVLLEAVRRHRIRRFLQISTDEVYGSIARGACREDAPLKPSSPYSASKAGADLLVQAYGRTFGLPVLIVRSSNNFGPRQYPEKLIPLFVTNALEDRTLPLYGDGLNVRDWIYVEDNCAGVAYVLSRGRPGEVYNLGGGNPRTNRQITEAILRLLGKPGSLVRRVADRPGHDRRYALDSGRLSRLGWNPQRPFLKALQETVAWYRDHPEWWRPLKGRAYRRYYRQQYGRRRRPGSART